MEIKVHLNSKRNFICPNPASVLTEQDSSIPQEQMYENMWIVDKQEYDTCSVNTSVLSDPLVNRNLMICRNPLQLRYYEMVFRSKSPPGGLEFTPGITYYFIGKKEPPRRGGEGRTLLDSPLTRTKFPLP